MHFLSLCGLLITCHGLSIQKNTTTLEHPSILHVSNLKDTTLYKVWPQSPYHHYYSNPFGSRLIKFLHYGAKVPSSQAALIIGSLEDIIVQLLQSPSFIGVEDMSFWCGPVTFNLEFRDKVQLKTLDVALDLNEVARLMQEVHGPREILRGELGPVEPWLSIVAVWSIRFELFGG